MLFGSVASGIEAASCAWSPLGWRARFFSEIDPFACALLKYRYPDVENLGDMTGYREWNNGTTLDLLVGGTPCQSFSVAGLRRGLDDPRGDLMLTYLAIVRRFAPRWIVWENVAGVLSSNGGRDFGTFLGGLAQLGYGFAYRVLDAQFYGVPQRRRRVFVIGHSGDWRAPAAVLFERASLFGDPPPSRKAGQGIAATLTRGANSSGKGGYAGRRREDDENLVIAPTLSARTLGGGGLGSDFEMDGGLIPTLSHALRGESFDAGEDGTGRGTPLIAVPYSLAIRGRGGERELEYRQDGTANALLAPDGGRDGLGVGAIAVDMQTIMQPGNRSGARPGPAPTLARLSRLHALDSLVVRRLTPRECERLQGFEDDYTLVPYRKAFAVDGNRYKALGNSMAVPVMHWIGRRIELVERILADRETSEMFLQNAARLAG